MIPFLITALPRALLNGTYLAFFNRRTWSLKNYPACIVSPSMHLSDPVRRVEKSSSHFSDEEAETQRGEVTGPEQQPGTLVSCLLSLEHWLSCGHVFGKSHPGILPTAVGVIIIHSFPKVSVSPLFLEIGFWSLTRAAVPSLASHLQRMSSLPLLQCKQAIH